MRRRRRRFTHKFKRSWIDFMVVVGEEVCQAGLEASGTCGALASCRAATRASH
jgi:hypothetical protein